MCSYLFQKGIEEWLSSEVTRRRGLCTVGAPFPLLTEFPTTKGEKRFKAETSQCARKVIWLMQSTSATVKADRKIKKRFVSRESCIISSVKKFGMDQ